MTHPSLLLPSAGDLVASLARRDVTAVDLCERTIAAIEQEDRELNAVVVRDFDRARLQAREADQALARGERRPLLGLPMTVKESFDVAGLPTTWGFPHARDIPVAQDAVMVQRLKAAGAVILGKTNVSMGLRDWQSLNQVYGRTTHPFDPRFSAGGSSGGSAAALAAGLVALELGSDIGGSIRTPAAFCGVYGHKPTHGLLPTRGHGFPGYVGAPDVLSVVGPMARHAADLRLALAVLAGPDDEDATACRVSLPPPRHPGIAGHRVLVLDRHPTAPCGTDVRAAVQDVASRLSDAGAEVTHRSDLLPDLEAAQAHYLGLLLTVVLRGVPGAPPPITAPAWLDLLDHRHRLRSQWRRFFERYDAVLAPCFGTAAFLQDDLIDPQARELMIDGQRTPCGEQVAWAGIATLPGLPATALPSGVTANGLPLGVQLIGPHLEDHTPLALAGALQALDA